MIHAPGPNRECPKCGAPLSRPGMKWDNHGQIGAITTRCREGHVWAADHHTEQFGWRGVDDDVVRHEFGDLWALPSAVAERIRPYEPRILP